MKKNEIENELIERIGVGHYIDITKLVTIQDRMNKRFTGVVGKYLTVEWFMDHYSLMLTPEMDTSMSWGVDFDLQTMRTLMKNIPQPVYIVERNIAADYEENTVITMVTFDKRKALDCFKEIVEKVKENAEEWDYVSDETGSEWYRNIEGRGEGSFEAYRDGYAAQDHEYVTLHREYLQ